LKELLNYGITNKCSDIHITERKISKVRIQGDIKNVTGKIIGVDTIDGFVEEYMPKVLNKYIELREHRVLKPVDAAFEYLGRRFRANIYMSSSGINLAIRILNDKFLTLDKLCLPESIANFTELGTGLVLVVGTTGSGKSTTLASIIDAINHKRCENIITIEHPIEYKYVEDLCRIEQCEVGTHVESFDEATIAAMRQDPDIVLVGELRDLSTIQNAVTLAETGHLVFGTLHAKSIPDTVDRIIDVFPAGQQEQIRFQVSSVLKGIVHQRLIKSNLGGMTPLVEMLMLDDVASAMIRQRQKSNALRDYLRGKSELGNVHIADNAAWHSKCGRIDIESIKNILLPDDYNIAKSILSERMIRGGF